MSSSRAAAAGSAQTAARRNFLKCETCRARKIKCIPSDRDWSQGQICVPCRRDGRQCGPNVVCVRTHRPKGRVPRSSKSRVSTLATYDAVGERSSKSSWTLQSSISTPSDLATGGSTSSVEVSDAQHNISKVVEKSERSRQSLSRVPVDGQKDSEINDHVARSAELGQLAVLLKYVRAVQYCHGSNHNTQEARDIAKDLKNLVWYLDDRFVRKLSNFKKLAENQTVLAVKLNIYQEAYEISEAIDPVYDKTHKVRAGILRKMIAIYIRIGNMPAAERKHLELSELARQQNTELDDTPGPSIADCYQSTCEEISRRLEGHALNLPPLDRVLLNSCPILHRALREHRSDIVTAVLANNIDAVKDRDMLGQDVIMAAAAMGSTALVEPALHDDTYVRARDPLHRTAIFHAARNGHFNCFVRLATAGARLDDRDISGQSILQAAVVAGSTAIVGYLLDHGVVPNDPTWIYGSTALHDAARRGHLVICQHLLSKGAWANLRREQPGGMAETPSESASRSGHPDIAALIEEAARNPQNCYPQQQQGSGGHAGGPVPANFPLPHTFSTPVPQPYKQPTPQVGQPGYSSGQLHDSGVSFGTSGMGSADNMSFDETLMYPASLQWQPLAYWNQSSDRQT